MNFVKSKLSNLFRAANLLEEHHVFDSVEGPAKVIEHVDKDDFSESLEDSSDDRLSREEELLQDREE